MGPRVEPGRGPRPRAEPFYNPAMALDRDIAVALARVVEPAPETGWETNAATGVRGLRLLAEAGPFRSFVLTEASPRSFEALRQNADGDPRAQAVLGDASTRAPGTVYDYVDVDPYGSPLRFLPAAIAATRVGGVLGVTATDMMVLAGAQPAACRRIYGAEPVRGRLGPEGALRILLRTIDRVAREAGRGFEPLLSYVGGHHVRVFARVGRSPDTRPPVEVVDPAAWAGPALGGRAPIGPLWLGPIADLRTAERLAIPPTAAEPVRLRRFVELMREDARNPAPFYYEPNVLAGSLQLRRPPALELLIRSLRDAGYRASRTHVRPEGVRTDASRPIVEEAARRVSEAP